MYENAYMYVWYLRTRESRYMENTYLIHVRMEILTMTMFIM